MKHRLHVVSLPHTQTTTAFSSCAYTEKVRKFCNMMNGRGHEVLLYAGEENEAHVSEFVTCLPKGLASASLEGRHYTEGSFDTSKQSWIMFNATCQLEMTKRIQPRDFICLIGGVAQKSIADSFPNHMSVEFGVGYSGTFANYKVYESYAWMHTCHGAANPQATMHATPNWYDAVIPGYVDLNLFDRVLRNRPKQSKRTDYVLYLGRVTPKKGVDVAIEAAKLAKKRLIIAGPGISVDVDCEQIGEVGPENRRDLMSDARCVIAPTLYAEPFGNVVVEALVCGTPVITTDWGAFTETVQQGVNGYRCRMLSEFVQAIKDVDKLHRPTIFRNARARYDMKKVAVEYEAYFNRLSTMWGKGWSQLQE